MGHRFELSKRHEQQKNSSLILVCADFIFLHASLCAGFRLCLSDCGYRPPPQGN